MSLLNVRLPTSISVMFLFLMSFLLAKQVQITLQVGTLGRKNQNWINSSPIRSLVGCPGKCKSFKQSKEIRIEIETVAISSFFSVMAVCRERMRGILI